MVKATSNHLEKSASPRTVVVVTLLLIGALWTAIGVWAVSARHERIATTGQALQRMNHAVDDQTRRQFRLADVFLTASEHWLEGNPRRDPRTDPAFRKLIESFRARTGETIAIRLIAPDGGMFDIGGKRAKPLANVADSDFFKGALPGENPFIGTPSPSQPDGHAELPVALRLQKPVGDWSMLVAVIDLTKLGAVYEKQLRKPGGTITLLRHDGTVLARAPTADQLLGQPFTGGPLPGTAQAPQASNVVVVEKKAGSHPKQITSYSSMPDFPLLVIVSADYDEALGPWQEQTLWVILLALGVTVPMAIVAYRSLLLLQALATRDEQLHHLATTDRLTGASSRQHFVETLEKLLRHSNRERSTLTILVFAIDFFKRINDGYGHAVGDQVLIQFAAVAKECLRGVDLLGRLSGGEFAILLPDTDAASSVLVAERIRQAIADISIPTENGTVHFTTSVGASQVSATDQSFDDVLKRAAEGLYGAKAGGHDHLVVI
ncbi:diguanylate cyclase [Accumulibacter sp.]|uniref:sensor domain-containing diguanylate cyclase n=1 Tax=Accumulibacter sp. TaxID=2053492 RepID=UPI0028C4FC23|nr:diguanylate cyclase [Accumulibacter sp.]